jgi:ABC-type dipeptide/oligopeptide/nickel transport system permease component
MFLASLSGLQMALVCLAILATVCLLALPYSIARRRNHPNKTAIRVCALCGLVFPPFWLAALVWSFTGPAGPAPVARPKGYTGAKSLSFPGDQ